MTALGNTVVSCGLSEDNLNRDEVLLDVQKLLRVSAHASYDGSDPCAKRIVNRDGSWLYKYMSKNNLWSCERTWSGYGLVNFSYLLPGFPIVGSDLTQIYYRDAHVWTMYCRGTFIDVSSSLPEILMNAFRLASLSTSHRFRGLECSHLDRIGHCYSSHQVGGIAHFSGEEYLADYPGRGVKVYTAQYWGGSNV